MVVAPNIETRKSQLAAMPSTVNTSAFKNDDLQNFINESENISQFQRNRKSSKFRGAIKSKLLKQEIFEPTENDNVDDDAFLSALEHQNSFQTPSKKFNLTHSIENIMRYIDDDVKVEESSSDRAPTPTRQAAAGKVAYALAFLKAKTANATNLPFTLKSANNEQIEQPARSIEVLKKKYENEKLNSQTKTTEKQAKLEKLTSSAINPTTSLQRKSKVKQMAQLFNTKIMQIMQRNGGELNAYEPLHNEFSPEAKPIARPLYAKTKPAARLRNRTPSFRASPVPSPRQRRKQLQKTTSASCLVAEDVFRQLTVKDKALLYQKFIEDMSHKNPEFSKHAELMVAAAKRNLAQGEVITETHGTVKDIAQMLEAKCLSPNQHMCETLTNPKSPLSQTSLADKSNANEMVQLSENELEESMAQTNEDQLNAEQSMHRSTLYVTLKPSPDGKKPTPLPILPQQMMRRHRNDMPFHIGSIEPSHKRNNNAVRSMLPTEAYAPPKKIRRTRAERLAPKMFFQNQHMERLFYNWLREKNGISFDISLNGKMETNVEIAVDMEEQQTISLGLDDEFTNKSTDRLLQETIAKLENVNIMQKEDKFIEDKEIDTAMAIIQNTLEEQSDSRRVSVVEVELPVEKERKRRPAPQPPTQTTVTTVTSRPPVPAPRTSLSSASSLISSAISSAKQSADESESGLSTMPKPPENELQKSHDHNPAALSEHQLRVQASLQRLNIPDWFRQYNQGSTTNTRSPDGTTATTTTSTTGAGGATLSTYRPGNFTRKRTTESGRWAGLNSKTTSLSSLGSQRSDRSPLLLSPSAHSHHGGQTAGGQQQQQHHHLLHASGSAGASGGGVGFTRWSTSHLNSSQTSPSVSQRGSFSRGGPVNSSFMSVASGQTGVSFGTGSVIRNSFRQPYLGWRSQEKLSQRTPHERLASSLLAQQQRTSPTQRTANGSIGNAKLQPQAVTPEIQSSIKEVTSAIVHYVNDQTQQQQRSRSASPNSRKCWLESSFVGIRPLESPQTPVIDGATTFSSTANNLQLNTNNNNNNININNTNNNNNNLYFNNKIGIGGLTAAEAGAVGAGATATTVTTTTTTVLGTTNAEVLRMNGLSLSSGAPERSLSNASLEDVLASLLGLPSNTGNATNAGVLGASSASDAYARSTTGDSASENLITYRHMSQQQQYQQQQQPNQKQQQQQLQVNLSAAEQQRLRRRSEGDAPTKQQQLLKQQPQQQQNATTTTTTTIGPTSGSAGGAPTTTGNGSIGSGGGTAGTIDGGMPMRRVSLGDSSESNNKTTSELQIKCRNTKCDRSATPADAKKYYKSCHNCTHLYCTRECRRAHWEKHRKACLHSRASNLCRQVLATCKDDLDSQRHLSLLARKGFLSQGRGVVRVLFRSADRAESFVKNGFQCMGEASYVRWPDLMPAEMGLELYSELLKLSTEYKPDSKMLIYVAICVVSEAPGMGQAPVRWERQLVSRCAKLKLSKSILAELELAQQAMQQQQPVAAVVAVPEPTTEILILTFNPSLRTSIAHGELILSNILDILSRRGVLLRKHYPEIYQRLQSYTEGQTDKFNPVTLHPRDTQTGQSFVCIIMPVHSDGEIIRLPSAMDGGNRVTSIDVGSPAALAEFDDDELLTRSAS